MLTFLQRSFQSLAPLFRPPFPGLWIVALIYYVWCFCLYPNNQVFRGDLPDPDDYMYLTQILDWMGGQSWYDNVQHRLDPPAGVPIHFSRLAMLPMAAIIILFEHMGLGPRGAATIMALIEPLILMGAYFVSLRWLTECFMPKAWAGVTAYVALFSLGTLFMFMPGHVDHHGLIIVLMTLVLGCAVRMMQEPADMRWGLYAGLGLALAMIVALEVLPWLLVISGVLGLWAMAKGHAAARNSFVFALALYLVSVVGVAITRAPAHWFDPDVLTYSIVYAYLSGGVAVGFAGIALTAQAKPWVRWASGLVLAGLSGFWFLHKFPDLIMGPYGGMDPQLAQMMLDEIEEATPLIHIAKSWMDFFTHIAMVSIALFVSWRFFRRSSGEARWSWGLIGGLLLAAFLLTLFYQYRFMGVMGMLMVIPLAVLLQRGWEWIGTHYQGRKKVWAEIGLLLLVGPFPAVLFPALIDGRSLNVGVLLFPVDGSVSRTPCDTFQLERVLNDPAIYGDRSRLIVSNMGQGPELLFRSPHQILAAPFHMDVMGNIDATRFFSTPYTSEAEGIARRRHIDLAITCMYTPKIYMRLPSDAASPERKISGDDFSPHLIKLLMTNKAPAWLKRRDFPGLDNFLIYEVNLPAETKKASHGKSAHAPKQHQSGK